MKSFVNYVCLLGTLLVLANCSTNHKEAADATESAASTDSTVTTDTATIQQAVANPTASRKFIRTADLKFKVQDVAKATYAIENITSRLGGFVTSSDLTSTVDNTTTTAISADSALETTYYTVSNEMVLRVPNARLDSTLKAIAGMMHYLDYRRITADDVGLQQLANTARQKRLTQHNARLAKAIDKRGKKLTETTAAEDGLLYKREQADEAALTNLSLIDRVAYSTVSLSVYQRQAVTHTLLPNHKIIDAYEPGFGKKMLEAAATGWEILEAFLLFLTKLWGVFVFIFIACLLYRKYSPKFKS